MKLNKRLGVMMIVLNLYLLFENWKYIDTICAIEYVKYFISSFDEQFSARDQVIFLIF